MQVNCYVLESAHFENHLIELEEILSREEKARANRFKFVAGRNEYIIARSMLKKVLASHLNTHPTDIQLNYSAKGKPYLPSSPLQFNLSHSHGIIMFAIANNELGVDIEFIKRDNDIAALKDLVFHPHELAKLESIFSPEIFFTYWTAKEALVKGLGEGLGFEFKKIVTSIDSNTVQYYSLTETNENTLAEWRGIMLFPYPSYTATLTVKNSTLLAENVKLHYLTSET